MSSIMLDTLCRLWVCLNGIDIHVLDKVVSRFDVGKSWIQSIGKLVAGNKS